MLATSLKPVQAIDLLGLDADGDVKCLALIEWKPTGKPSSNKLTKKRFHSRAREAGAAAKSGTYPKWRLLVISRAE